MLAEFNTGQVAVPEDGSWMEVILQSRGRGRGEDILGGAPPTDHRCREGGPGLVEPAPSSGRNQS